MKQALLAILFLALAQTGAWFQQFAQIRWDWFRDRPWFNALVIGIPISFLFIYGARFAYESHGFSVECKVNTIYDWYRRYVRIISTYIRGGSYHQKCDFIGSIILYCINPSTMEVKKEELKKKITTRIKDCCKIIWFEVWWYKNTNHKTYCGPHQT